MSETVLEVYTSTLRLCRCLITVRADAKSQRSSSCTSWTGECKRNVRNRAVVHDRLSCLSTYVLQAKGKGRADGAGSSSEEEEEEEEEADGGDAAERDSMASTSPPPAPAKKTATKQTMKKATTSKAAAAKTKAKGKRRQLVSFCFEKVGLAAKYLARVSSMKKTRMAVLARLKSWTRMRLRRTRTSGRHPRPKRRERWRVFDRVL